MRILVVGIILTIWLTASLANGHGSHPKITAWSAPTVTKSVPALVKFIKIPRPKIFRSNPFKAAYLNSHWEQNDEFEIDDDAKITGPRREDYGRVRADSTPEDPEGDVTPDIEWQLFLIRQAVLLKYRTLHT
jgi:hypothetical protein